MPLYSVIVESFQDTGANNTNIIFPLILAGITVLYAVSWIVSVPLLKSAKR